jgi:hypothetical protein
VPSLAGRHVERYLGVGHHRRLVDPEQHRLAAVGRFVVVREPFGSSIGFMGVSLLDVSPYIYDAFHPKLVLLTGRPVKTPSRLDRYSRSRWSAESGPRLGHTGSHARRGYDDDRTSMGSHSAVDAVQRSSETLIAI